jgi:hypothetical protein
LDEPSAKERAAFGLREETENRGLFPAGLRLMLFGGFVLVAGVFNGVRGQWPEALYTLGSGVALIAFGAWWSGRAPKEGPPAQETRAKA